MVSSFDAMTLDANFQKRRPDLQRLNLQHLLLGAGAVCLTLFFAFRSQGKPPAAPLTPLPPASPARSAGPTEASLLAFKGGVAAVVPSRERPLETSGVQRVLAKLGKDLSREQALLEEAESTAKREDKLLSKEEKALKKEQKAAKDLQKDWKSGNIKHYWKDDKAAQKSDKDARGDSAVAGKEDDLLQHQVAQLNFDAQSWPSKEELRTLGEGASWFEHSRAELEHSRKQLAQRMEDFHKRQHKMDQTRSRAEELEKKHAAEANGRAPHKPGPGRGPHKPGPHRGPHKGELMAGRMHMLGEVEMEQQALGQSKRATQELQAAVKNVERLLKRETQDLNKGESALARHKLPKARLFEHDEEDWEQKESQLTAAAGQALEHARAEQADVSKASQQWSKNDAPKFPMLNRRHQEQERRRAKIAEQITQLEKKLKQDLHEKDKLHSSADSFRRKLSDEGEDGETL